jgi:long-chain acyl-CoA synthetase
MRRTEQLGMRRIQQVQYTRIGAESAICLSRSTGRRFLHPAHIRSATKRVFKKPPATLREFFGSARGIDATFVIYKDEEWSFRDVIEETDKPSYASVYRYGVNVVDRVGIATRNMPEWLIASAAMASISGVSVSLNAGRGEDASDDAI